MTAAMTVAMTGTVWGAEQTEYDPFAEGVGTEAEVQTVGNLRRTFDGVLESSTIGDARLFDTEDGLYDYRADDNTNEGANESEAQAVPVKLKTVYHGELHSYDFDYFSINVPVGTKLIISYICSTELNVYDQDGYLEKVVPAGNLMQDVITTRKSPYIDTFWTDGIVEDSTYEVMYSLEESFLDVMDTGKWYYEPIYAAVVKGIASGTDENHFSPNATCTRAQAMTFIYHALNNPQAAKISQFSDVYAGKWYTDAVNWAVGVGVTGGIGDGKFGTNDTCTRAQIVTFIWKALGCPDPGPAAQFSDVADGKWYTSAVSWAVNNGVTGGIGNGKFGPNEPCTRAQVVTFLYKAIK